MMEKREKTLADLTKEQQAEIKTGLAMQSLLNVEGWKFYEKVLRVHLEAKRNEAEAANPLDAEDGLKYALRMERAKGAIIGLRLALEQPSIMIAVAKERHANLLGSEMES